MSGKECKQVCGVCSFGSWNNRKSKIIVLCKWCYGDSLHIVWSEWWRVPMFAAHAVRTNIITYHTMLPLNHCATSTYLSPSPEPWWCKCMWCAHMTVAYILQNTRDPKCVRQWVPCREWVWNIKGNVRARKAAQKSHKFAKQNSLAFFFFRKAFFRLRRRDYCCSLRASCVVRWSSSICIKSDFLSGADWCGWTKYLQRKWRRDECEWPGPVGICWTRMVCSLIVPIGGCANESIQRIRRQQHKQLFRFFCVHFFHCYNDHLHLSHIHARAPLAFTTIMASGCPFSINSSRKNRYMFISYLLPERGRAISFSVLICWPFHRHFET